MLGKIQPIRWESNSLNFHNKSTADVLEHCTKTHDLKISIKDSNTMTFTLSTINRSFRSFHDFFISETFTSHRLSVCFLPVQSPFTIGLLKNATTKLKGPVRRFIPSYHSLYQTRSSPRIYDKNFSRKVNSTYVHWMIDWLIANFLKGTDKAILAEYLTCSREI